MMRITDRCAALLLGLLPGLALAQADAGAAPAQVVAAAPATAPNKLDQTKEQLTKLPSAADLRPSGPITINANKAELVQGNSAVYVGNVTLDSDTLKMDGDRLELKRAADGQYTAKVTGAPAHMSHTGNGPDNPAMTAHARTMTYDSRAGVIDLAGDAEMTRGSDKTNAETIRYYLVEQRYEAAGDNSGKTRVQIVIPQVTPNPPAPAPAPPAAPAAPPAAAPGQAPAPHS
jgi:lipopolysaccharide transport protein LptA